MRIFWSGATRAKMFFRWRAGQPGYKPRRQGVLVAPAHGDVVDQPVEANDPVAFERLGDVLQALGHANRIN